MSLNIPFFTNYLISRAGKIADFDTEDAKPIKYCKKIKQPVLLVHGNKDDRVKIQYGKENYSKLNNPQSEFIEVENASHLNVWEIGGESYFEKAFAFIEKNTP